MMRWIAQTAFCLMLCLLARPAHGQPVTTRSGVRGVIASSDGQPISGAVVSVARTLPGATASVPAATGAVAGRGISGANGAFSIDKLPPGPYFICFAAFGYLDPCHWSAAPPTTTVGAGRVTDVAAVTVNRGALLKVRINDAAHLLADAERRSQTTLVTVGMYSPANLFYPAPVKASDAAGRTYAIAAPFGTEVRLMLASQSAQFTDEAGAAVGPPGRTFAVTVPAGTNEKVFSFTVSGVAAP